MIKVYKIPTDIVKPEFIRGLVGSEGTVPNPIQDINGNWIISVEEWDDPEFDGWKTLYAEHLPEFQKIDYFPKPSPPLI